MTHGTKSGTGWVAAIVIAALVAPAAQAAGRGEPAARGAAAGRGYHSPGYAGRTRLGTLVPSTLPSITLGTGKYPHLFVDGAGTAQIVYTVDGASTAPDTLSYCGLQRGQASCGATNGIPTPIEPEGDPNFPGNFPAGNHDFDGPVPLDIGNTLYIVQRRFPDAFPTPGGGSSESNVFLWSQDAVTGKITGPAQIGDNQMAGGAIAYGGTSNPSIGTISATETGGTYFQGVPAGQYTTSKAQLGTGDQAYDGGLALDGVDPVAVFADLSGNVFIREYLGHGDVNDAINWSETSFQGYSPQIVGGAAGVFVMYRDGALEESNVLLRKIVGGQPSGGPVQLSGAVSDPTVSESPSGRIAFGYVDSLGVEVRTSTDGTNFSSPEVTALVPSGGTVSDLSVAATADGGGFATFVKDGTGAEDVGTVVASAFGTQQATGLPGLGTLQPGGIGSPIGDQLATSTCNTATFGLVEAKLDAGCWFHDPSQPTLDVSLGPVDINGLEIVPDANAKILIDPRLHTIDTVGKASVQLRAPGIAPITLWHDEIHVKLPVNIPAGFPLFDFSPPSPPDLLGFPIDGKIDAQLIKGGVRVPISLSLQPSSFFGGVTGSAVLQATLNGGLMINSLLFTVGDVSLGAFELKDVRITYQSSGDTWAGQGTLNVPTGGGIFNMSIDITFEHGDFSKGTVIIGLPYPGIPLDDNDAPAQQLWFDKFGLSVGLDPPLVGGSVDFGFTPTSLPGDPMAGPRDFAFSLHAGATLSFGKQVTLTATGTGYLEQMKIESGTLVYTLPDTVVVTGKSGYDLGLISEEGTFGAIFDPQHHTYGVRVRGDTTLDLPLPIGSVDISSGAFAANGNGFGIYFPFGSPPSGVPYPGGLTITYNWGDPGGPQLTWGHDVTSQFTQGVPTGAGDRRTAHAAAATSFTVRGHPSALDIRATGAGGAPSVVLTSPSGAQIVPSTSGGAFAVPNPAADTTFVGVLRPARGRWSVQAAPDSTVPLAGVGFAVAEAAPKVHARLAGHGSVKTVRYRVSLAPGTTVKFAEQTKSLLHMLGEVTHRTGKFHFTPAIGAPGRRQLVALIENRGLPFSQQVIASFTVPRPPKPGRPKRLRIRSSARAFTVTFKRPSNAVRTVISIVTTDGRHLQQIVKVTTHRLSIPVLGYQDGVKVTVAGVDAAGRRGPSASARAKRRR
jgi:hypothetical protein